MKIVKYTLILVLSVIFLSTNSFSQDENIDDIELRESDSEFDSTPQNKKLTYFTFGGGYFGNLLLNDLNPLYNHLYENGFLIDEFSSFTYMHGIQGFTTIPSSNFRLGYLVMWGNNVTEKESSDDNQKHGTDYSVDFSMLTLDYAFVPFKSLAILAGVGLGFGDLSLEAYRVESSYDWDDIGKDEIEGSFIRAENFYFVVQPNLNIEYAITTFSMIRMNVNYSLGVEMGDGWVINKSASLKNVGDGINFNGVSAQIGLFIGVFNY